MTVAEILDANRGPHGWDRGRAESAINAALELAAQEAENFKQCFDKAGEIASRIRRLKSLAGPVQPTDASPARESDHAGL